MKPKYLRAGVLCLLILLSISFVSLAETNSSQSTVFLNVGEGDSALISDGNGFDVLIDGGKSSAGPTVDTYLHSQGITDLDVIVASHADADHIGGLIDVLDDLSITVDEVLYNGYPGSTATWTDFVASASARGLTLTQAQFPQELTWGNMQVYVLNPASGLVNPDTNDASLVLRVDYGSIRYLFTGDIPANIEATVVARQTPVAADVLKVPHHGSEYSSSAAFLAAVQPEDSVISVGPNSYGHPSPQTINRLKAVGSTVWRTDLSGNILITSDGTTTTIFPQNINPASPAVFLPLTLKMFPTQPPTTQTGKIVITSIFYDGSGSLEPDEYVQIQNQDTTAIFLQDWTLQDQQNHVYTFPAFTIVPGQVCRIYTNEDHPEWCGFDYASGSAIWNNSGDCAVLKDPSASIKSQFCY